MLLKGEYIAALTEVLIVAQSRFQIDALQGTTALVLDMAYRLLREFRQASTRLDTPPFSNRRHPGSDIALPRAPGNLPNAHTLPLQYPHFHHALHQNHRSLR